MDEKQGCSRAEEGHQDLAETAKPPMVIHSGEEDDYEYMNSFQAPQEAKETTNQPGKQFHRIGNLLSSRSFASQIPLAPPLERYCKNCNPTQQPTFGSEF